MKQKTLNTPEAAMVWINTHPHHLAALFDRPRYSGMMLANYDERVYIPTSVWSQLDIVPGGHLDARMYNCLGITKKDVG